MVYEDLAGLWYDAPREAVVQGIDAPPRWAFSAFLAADPYAASEFVAFEAVLADANVGDVVPAWHLWRQGSDWRLLGAPAFAVPPRETWRAILPTLRVLRDEVIPRVGTVEVVSAFRTEAYNAAAGGAPGSRHRAFEAVDVVPVRHRDRDALRADLIAWWRARGPACACGLGLYARTRFHVDAGWRHRTWGPPPDETPAPL